MDRTMTSREARVQARPHAVRGTCWMCQKTLSLAFLWRRGWVGMKGAPNPLLCSNCLRKWESLVEEMVVRGFILKPHALTPF